MHRILFWKSTDILILTRNLVIFYGYKRQWRFEINTFSLRAKEKQDIILLR